MAEKKDWRETMGAPFAEAEEPQYDVGAIRRATTDTPAHAEMFNGVFQQLIDNTAAVKRMAEGTQETLEREISNPNLLENWDFRNPVNRNGKEEYVGGNANIDRWRIVQRNSTVSISIDEGSVKFTNSNVTSSGKSSFWGYIGLSLKKNLYTLSVIIEEIEGDFNLGMQRDSSPWTNFADIPLQVGLNTATFNVNMDIPLINIYFMPAHKGYVKVKAIKLELGDHQTLARQNDSGEWEIIDPPNYDLQYALCSQYNPANGEWQGGVSLDANGRVPVAQLPFNDLTLYLSPTGVDAPDMGSEDKPLKSIYYAINTFGSLIRFLHLKLYPGSYGWIDVGNRWITLEAVNADDKPLLTGLQIGQQGVVQLNNCKIQSAIDGGDSHIKTFGQCKLYNVDFTCTGGTGNSSAITVRGGTVVASGCTFNGYRQSVILSYSMASPALVISQNNSGANPNAYAGVLVAIEGVIIWRKGTQPTGAGGTTTVVTTNGGQVYGS